MRQVKSIAENHYSVHAIKKQKVSESNYPVAAKIADHLTILSIELAQPFAYFTSELIKKTALTEGAGTEAGEITLLFTCTFPE